MKKNSKLCYICSDPRRGNLPLTITFSQLLFDTDNRNSVGRLDYCTTYQIEVTFHGYQATGKLDPQLPSKSTQHKYPKPDVTIPNVKFTELTCSAR